jgi:hypothetical protein
MAAVGPFRLAGAALRSSTDSRRIVMASSTPSSPFAVVREVQKQYGEVQTPREVGPERIRPCPLQFAVDAYGLTHRWHPLRRTPDVSQPEGEIVQDLGEVGAEGVGCVRGVHGTLSCRAVLASALSSTANSSPPARPRTRRQPRNRRLRYRPAEGPSNRQRLDRPRLPDVATYPVPRACGNRSVPARPRPTRPRTAGSSAVARSWSATAPSCCRGLRAPGTGSGTTSPRSSSTRAGLCGPASRRYEPSQIVPLVTSASCSAIGVTPRPGPVGTGRCPASSTNGSVMSVR